MTKKQVCEVIRLFKSGEYGLENAEVIGVSIDEFVIMFHAYRAVDGNNTKSVKGSMMHWLYWKNKMPMESIAELFDVTKNHVENICREIPSYSIPKDFGIRKKPGRICSSGAVFSKDDYGKDKFWRSK